MPTFTEFLQECAAQGEWVNTVFEQRVFELIGVLHRITEPLAAEGVAHELVGGLAVFVHVEEASPELSSVTRDVDLMINRGDLQRVVEITGRHGFRFHHAASLDMLIQGERDSERDAVHLRFSGERVKPSQATPNPPLDPERKVVHGRDVQVIRVGDLVRMKLSAFRDKDRVHVRAMDAAGLLTPAVEQALPPELMSRLRHVRETE